MFRVKSLLWIQNSALSAKNQATKNLWTRRITKQIVSVHSWSSKCYNFCLWDSLWSVHPPRKLTWLAGNSNMWRCISYWTCWIFKPVMLVFGSVNTVWKISPKLSETVFVVVSIAWICMRCLEQVKKSIPNGDLMVISHCTNFPPPQCQPPL